MARQSLFGILSRQPWWVSLLAAMAAFAIAQLIFAPVAPFVALPFIAIAIYLAWRQLRSISPETVETRLAAVRALSWEEFAALVSDAYRRRGYEVKAAHDGTFDFVLCQKGRISLVQCRRWKVNQVGVGPVRELYDALDKHDAYNGICLTAGTFSEAARQFAAGKPIALVQGADLAQLVGRTGVKNKPRQGT
ncbi:MAG: hypothetical protein K0R53_67 [Burkholderiales bacterium]|nr:hypothetical protein [Burkholderiales bacterium]